ncbi:MAG: hypothetical protein DHS20C12_00440 [Pseudohongiella sp.]|nr:MAG: hypothetical protein DHS20C12_00440 [Pseudohongiella sp.]
MLSGTAVAITEQSRIEAAQVQLANNYYDMKEQEHEHYRQGIWNSRSCIEFSFAAWLGTGFEYC